MNRTDLEMLLASSIHDMKNAIGMILNSVELASTQDDQEREKHLSILRYEAIRLNNDLMHLLGVYRYNTNTLAITIDEQEVIEVLEEIELRNASLFDKYNVTFQCDCDEELSWYFDSELILSVLNNVIVNGVRYTRSTIRLSAEVSDNLLVLCVEDDGEGFPASMLKTPELSVSAMNFRTGSTSLGLYFASKVAQMHKVDDLKGFITLENGGSLGGGVFKIYLP